MLKWVLQGHPEPGRLFPPGKDISLVTTCPLWSELGPEPSSSMSALAFHYKLLTSSPLTSHLPQEKFSQGSYSKIIIKGENG